MKSCKLLLMVMVSISFSACGGGSTADPITYTVGGTVSGLSGTGLVLQNNGGNNLAVGANGGFAFTTTIASGGYYDVTVLTHPSSPAQACVVTNGSGAVHANVTSVQVTCSTANEWTGVGGSNIGNQAGTYGTQGTAAPSNIPGARDSAVSWADAAGDFWLFGGEGYDSTGRGQFLNDLWKYSAGEWTWVGGSNLANQAGIYGHQGTAAPSNIPGGRFSAVSWADAAGNFWLFGGSGYNLTVPFLQNDLWKYSAGEWTWMGGSNLGNQPGTYGIQGTAASSNVPGARVFAVSWTDVAGNLWLFSGDGCDSDFCLGFLNDLWKYSAGEWTWIDGSNLANQKGTYGNRGTAAHSNIPGARASAVSWTDATGNFWLFGGFGYDSTGASGGLLNDLWKYSAGEWTWMGGSNLANQKGTYGTRGTAAAGNIPGARNSAVSWIDGSGNLWLFGGNGCDSVGTDGCNGLLNDLWKYSAGKWTWISGSNLANQKGTYGNQGTAARSNIPGARYATVSWTDAAGNLWLFGGSAYDSTGAFGDLNDLWKYVP